MARDGGDMVGAIAAQDGKGRQHGGKMNCSRAMPCLRHSYLAESQLEIFAFAAVFGMPSSRDAVQIMKLL